MRIPGIDIGIDAGGTKTEVLARDQKGRGFTILGPGANLQRIGVEATARLFADLVRQVRRHYGGRPVRGLCAGVAGAGRASDRDALTTALMAHLEPPLPARIVVVTDARIALEGAFEGGSGIIVIAGTGSMALARDRRGRTLRAGGWGYLLGDEGSGYAVGKAGLRALADAFDGGPETRLREDFASAFRLDGPEALIRRVYAEQWALADAAPLVLEAAEAGDKVAAGIVKEQTRLLARQVRLLVHRARDIEPRFSFTGGLTRNPGYAKRLREAILEVLPGGRHEAPRLTPVAGALLLASRTT